MTFMTLKPTTVPDRSQAYVHAPQRAVAAGFQHHQRRPTQQYVTVFPPFCYVFRRTPLSP
jgi:hypothetical protein